MSEQGPSLEVLRQVAATHPDHQVTLSAVSSHTGLPRYIVQTTLIRLLQGGQLEAKYRLRRGCGDLLDAERFETQEAALGAVDEREYPSCGHCDEEVTPETIVLETLYWVRDPKKVLTHVGGDDWNGVYIDGELTHEGHSINIWDWLELVTLGVTHTETMECDQSWLESRGRFPQLLQDVKLLEES